MGNCGVTLGLPFEHYNILDIVNVNVTFIRFLHMHSRNQDIAINRPKSILFVVQWEEFPILQISHQM